MTPTLTRRAGRLARGDRVSVEARTYVVAAISALGDLVAAELVDPTTETLDAFGEPIADGIVVVLDAHDVIVVLS